jgi:hypothetical protein
VLNPRSDAGMRSTRHRQEKGSESGSRARSEANLFMADTASQEEAHGDIGRMHASAWRCMDEPRCMD